MRWPPPYEAEEAAKGTAVEGSVLEGASDRTGKVER